MTRTNKFIGIGVILLIWWFAIYQGTRANTMLLQLMNGNWLIYDQLKTIHHPYKLEVAFAASNLAISQIISNPEILQEERIYYGIRTLIVDLESILKSNPSSLALTLNLADLYVFLGNREGFERLAIRALVLSPQKQTTLLRIQQNRKLLEMNGR